MRDSIEYDPETDCEVYTGCWEENGQAKMRVGSRVYCVSRVAAWVYVEGFHLWSVQRVVRTCGTPACCNPDHLVMLRDQAEALARAKRMRQKVLGSRVRLTMAKVAAMRLAFQAGVALEELARGNGVSVKAARNAVSLKSWVKQNRR